MSDSNDDRRRPDRRGSGGGAGRGRNGGQGGARRDGRGARPSGMSGAGRKAAGGARGKREDGTGGRSGKSGGHVPDRSASPTRSDDPRGRSSSADVDPAIDPEVTGEELGEEVRSELGSLSGGLATRVAQHLVMAGWLLDEDPEQAYEHAQAARRRSARVGVVREVVGVTAYAAGKYAEALAELRAARRITGSDEYLPMMADCERGLGRPRRALELARDRGVERLDQSERIEMLIVAAGARRDLGETDAAVVALQLPELRSTADEDWVARLRYAYADALEAVGRRNDAARWFGRAAEADPEGLTDAAERAAALEPPAG